MVHHTTSEKTRLRLYRDYKICDSSFFSEGSASECLKKLKLFDQLGLFFRKKLAKGLAISNLETWLGHQLSIKLTKLARPGPTLTVNCKLL